MSPFDPYSNVVVGGRYHVETPLDDSGGMSSIYLGCVVGHPEQKAAIKFAKALPGADVSRVTSLLRREASLLSQWRIRHPGVVRIYPMPRDNKLGGDVDYIQNAGNLTGTPWYIVMEYLPGGSLAAAMDSIREYPLSWKMELFYQIAMTVQFLHQIGIGHRDLKLENILLREPPQPERYPQVVLVDFALACGSEEKDPTVLHSYTLEYASPERVLRNISGSSLADNGIIPEKEDVWGLGIVFYEIITGGLPFSGTNKDEIKTTIIEGHLQKEVLEQAPYMPKVLANLIRGMVIADPVIG